MATTKALAMAMAMAAPLQSPDALRTTNLEMKPC
jgi:hypothetical protein